VEEIESRAGETDFFDIPVGAFDQENSSGSVPYLKIHFCFLCARLNARKHEAEIRIAAQKVR